MRSEDCRPRLRRGVPIVLATLIASLPALASVKHPSWHAAAVPSPSQVVPDGVPVAVDVKTSLSNGVTRLVFDLSAKVAVETAFTANPDRLVIDLPEVNFQIDPAAGRLASKDVGLIHAFRFGLFAPGKSRIVVDLAGAAALRRADVSSIAGGDASRLTVDIVPSDRAAFDATARRTVHAAAPPPSGGAVTAAVPDARPVVVIDPGHGGIDPGASGVLGAVEKDVVLQFASALAAKLSATDRYRVVMTRQGDTFVSLGDRVRVARDADAALFISIHADTLSDRAVTGATVYTVSDQASDAEAGRVAATENEADAAAGVDEAPKVADVSDILFDLTRRETRTFAHQFQRTLTGYWAKIARLNHNPERSAGFKVLQAPDVPSVLLELGYLSSGEDARALQSPEWREKTVTGVVGAVDRFFGARERPAAAAANPASPPGPAAMR